MSITDFRDYKVVQVDYNDRIFSLKNQAVGVVKSEKFFPVFDIDGVKYVFKPLSRTKPLTTPLFAYAEVFWSNIINEFFMDAPIYRLAKISNYNVPKYYEFGTLVPYMLKEGEKLVNLLEFFIENEDENVNIRDYENYCMRFYDYVDILKSPLMEPYADDLAFQILMSILRADQNYHYENISFIYGNNIRVAPPIDHEFSTFFLFPDLEEMNCKYFTEYLFDMTKGVLFKNIKYIMEHHKSVVDRFSRSMDEFERYLKENREILTNTYDFPANSFLYQAGIKRYKENNEAEAIKIESELVLSNINYDEANRRIWIEAMVGIVTMRKVFNGDFF